MKTQEKNPLTRAVIHLQLNPSKTYLLLVVLLHCLTVAVVWLSTLPLWSLICLTFLLVINLYFWIAQWLRGKPLVLLNQSDQWLLTNQFQCWRLVSCHYVSRWLIVLKVSDLEVKSKWSRIQFLPVFFDACKPDQFKHLRVACRFLF